MASHFSKQEEWFHIVVFVFMFQPVIWKLCTKYSFTEMNIFQGHCSALYSLFSFSSYSYICFMSSFFICNYIPAKILNFFSIIRKVWLLYHLRKFLFTSPSATLDL
jgi:hypothetical protein